MTEPPSGAASREVERRQVSQLVEGRSQAIDRIRTLIEGGLGAIPIVGSGAQAIFKIAWAPAFERQTRRMLELLFDEVLNQNDRLSTLEEVAERFRDEDVAAVGLTAVSISGRTSSDEKLRHIAVGVSQVITGNPPWSTDIDFTMVMMNLIDDLTATQIAFLTFLADPGHWEQSTGRPLDSIPVNDEGRLETAALLTHAFPDYAPEPAMLRAMVSGIEARGLVNVIGLATEGSGYASLDEFRDGSVSDLGRALLRFLKLPQI